MAKIHNNYGVRPHELTLTKQQALINRFTITLQNGNKLVPSWSDVLKILEDNYKISLAGQMTVKNTEVPHVDPNNRGKKGFLKQNVLRGYDPNKSYYEGNARSIEDDTASRRVAYTASESAKSLREAWDWANKLSKPKKGKRKKNPGSGDYSMDSKAAFLSAFKRGYNATGGYKEIHIPYTYPRLIIAYKAGLKASAKDRGEIKRGNKYATPAARRYDKLKQISERAELLFVKAVRKQFPKRNAGDMRYHSDKFNAETKKAHALSKKATAMLLNHIRGKKP